MGWGAALLFLVLALPFDSFWPDFEVARRGLLLLCAGALAALAPRWLRRPLPRGSVLLACLCAWLLVRTIDVTNPMEGLFRAAHWIALWIVFVWGSRLEPAATWRAILPVTLCVAISGLAQAWGTDWPGVYGSPSEPVATLGNRNVASEFVALGVAAAALGAIRSSWPYFAALVAFLGAAYLGANGSRSGLVALGIVFALILIEGMRSEKRSRAVVAGAALALGFGISLVAFDRTSLPAVENASSSGVTVASDDSETERPTPSTVAIRLEMWRACLAMIGDAPLFGHGTGQFRYEYPRYRTAEEIELSSFGRQFPTFAASAHDDPLEIAVETGVPGLLTFFAFLVVACGPRLRTRQGWCELAPVLVFVWLTLVRSPIGNAPAAAFAMLCLGALARTASGTDMSTVGRGPRSWTAAFASTAVLTFLGLTLVLGQTHAADYVRSLQFDSPSYGALDRAVWWHGSESRFRSLRIRARRIAKGNAQAWAESTDDLTALAELDPNNVTALLLTAELANQAGNDVAARAALAQIGKLDPREPQATLLAAVMDAEDGKVADAIARLYARPHPRLRTTLATVLNDLSKIEPLQSNPQGAALLMRESAFVRTLDAMLADAASEQSRRRVQSTARMLRDDTRVRVLLARHLQATGETDRAAELAPDRLELSRSFRWLLHDVLDALRALPPWRDAIDRDDG